MAARHQRNRSRRAQGTLTSFLKWTTKLQLGNPPLSPVSVFIIPAAARGPNPLPAASSHVLPNSPPNSPSRGNDKTADHEHVRFVEGTRSVFGDETARPARPAAGGHIAAGEHDGVCRGRRFFQDDVGELGVRMAVLFALVGAVVLLRSSVVLTIGQLRWLELASFAIAERRSSWSPRATSASLPSRPTWSGCPTW